MLDENYWSISYNDPTIKTWSGIMFENLCKTHIKQIKTCLGISGILSANYSINYKAKTPEEKGAQIDLIIDRKDNVITFCEIKFVNGKFTITKDYQLNLYNKIEVVSSLVGKKKTIQLVMITTNGLTNNEYQYIVNKNILIDDLFVQ